MRLRNNILLLDTETTGDFGQPLVHDFGYIIIDLKFNVLIKRRFMVEQVRRCRWALDYSEFYRSKAYLYDKEIEDGFKPMLWGDIMAVFKRDLKRYHVKCISAYNVAFDFKALNFTNRFLADNDPLFSKLLDSKKWLCIWNLACETILNEPSYKKWVDDNDLRSQAGNYPTNAETVYKYLTRNMSFEEEHTALADVLIEKDILKYIANHCHKRPQYGLQYSCWQKIQGARN